MLDRRGNQVQGLLTGRRSGLTPHWSRPPRPTGGEKRVDLGVGMTLSFRRVRQQGGC